jgi:hypothetical protein
MSITTPVNTFQLILFLVNRPPRIGIIPGGLVCALTSP